MNNKEKAKPLKFLVNFSSLKDKILRIRLRKSQTIRIKGNKS